MGEHEMRIPQRMSSCCDLVPSQEGMEFVSHLLVAEADIIVSEPPTNLGGKQHAKCLFGCYCILGECSLTTKVR